MADLSKTQRTIKKWLIYPVQAIFVYALYYILRNIPIRIAAGMGAFIFKLIGPLTKAHKTALNNLKHAFPDWTEDKRKEVALGVWDNLGRGAGEYMQVDQLQVEGPNARIEVEGLEHLLKARDSGERYILFSAHMANWEVISVSATRYKILLTNVYRSASNPYVDKLTRKIRSNFAGTLIPKGRKGARKLITEFKNGKPLGMLVDQKLNEGVSIPFFGRDCMTASAPAELSIRFDCPLIPTQVIRLAGSKFKVIFYPPMEKPNTGNLKEDSLNLLKQVNLTLEKFIKEHPDQWLWVHKRWPKD